MRRGFWPAACVLLFTGLIVTSAALRAERELMPDPDRPQPEAKGKDAPLIPGELSGKTQPAPGHHARICTAVQHPVEVIHVAVGTRVKKDQDLIKMDSDEPEADVRSKKAMLAEMEASLARLKEEPRDEDEKDARASLESAKVSAREARELLERLEPAFRSGAVPEQKYIEIRALILRSQADERGAQARLDKLKRRPFQREVAEIEARIATAAANVKGAEAELEHYLMKSPIDGIVTSLDVALGQVSRPGTTTWGEIIDLKELDVLCEVPAAEVDGINNGMDALVLLPGRANGGLPGKVVNVGAAANRVSGHVPVLIRVANPDEKLRCYVAVKVRLGDAAKKGQ